MKKFIFLISLVGGVVLAGFFVIKNKIPPEVKSSENVEEVKVGEKFSVLSVYLTESEDPHGVFLTTKVKWLGKDKGAPACDIYFPPQEGMEQGTGPIERGCNFVEPLYQEGAEEKEAILREWIARSYYPDHFAPEFGKEYFVKIKFYWPPLEESYEWEGKIGWGRADSEN